MNAAAMCVHSAPQPLRCISPVPLMPPAWGSQLQSQAQGNQCSPGHTGAWAREQNNEYAQKSHLHHMKT